jgi:translation initiation factor IF-3
MPRRSRYGCQSVTGSRPDASRGAVFSGLPVAGVTRSTAKTLDRLCISVDSPAICHDLWQTRFRERVATAQENYAIRRPMRAPPPVQKDGPRVNEEIRSREVQLIDQTGHNHGPVDTRLALEKAQEAGLDLVEIAPNSDPPVCKILDFGKYKYQAQKKAAEARKKQKVVEVKEIKLRPMIDDHDYDVKMRSMKRFFEEGDKVKITLRFRGRELAHQELGYKLLNRVKDDTSDFAKVEQDARFEGRQVVMVLAPR